LARMRRFRLERGFLSSIFFMAFLWPENHRPFFPFSPYMCDD
jgi:hypothetical protein